MSKTTKNIALYLKKSDCKITIIDNAYKLLKQHSLELYENSFAFIAVCEQQQYWTLRTNLISLDSKIEFDALSQ